MKSKTRSFLISALLIFGMCFTETGTSWSQNDDLSPLLTEASPDVQTVLAQTDATAQTTPAETETSVQTKTKLSKEPSETKTTAPDKNSEADIEVVVRAEKKPEEGSAEAGYKTENIEKVGPWTDMKLQDTPYSINVMSSELIENIQVSTMDQLFKINPLVQVNYGLTRNGSGQLIMRGFNYIPAMEDGVRAVYNHIGVFLEDIERVEVLSGLSGFLYGPANVGGTINYVLKRPTAERLNKVTVGNYGGSNYYTHGDFGGPIDKNDKFGYRLNVLWQDGDTAVDGQSLKRELVSGAIDWHITEDVLLQADASHNYSFVQGVQVAFFNTGAPPDAPSADKLWSPSWTYNEVTTNKAGTNLTWNINDNLTLRSAYRYRHADMEGIWGQNYIDPDGTITNKETDKTYPYKFINTGYNTFLDKKFNMGSIEHKVTVGIYGDTYKLKWTGASYQVAGTAYTTPTDPSNYAMPSFTSPANGMYENSRTTYTNVIIGDNVKFNEQWSALLGVNRAEIEAKSFNSSGAQTADYDKSEITPSVSLIFKPIPSLSTYVSYMEGLEKGGTAPTTYGGQPVTNAGEVLEPMVDRQYEIGVKKTLGKTLLTGALFYIDKANQYVDPTTYTYVQDGREVHQGFEFTVTGKATDRLTLLGGFTIMDCKIKETNTSSYKDNVPEDIAERMAKLYAEYEMPHISGFFLSGGAFYTGPFYRDASNTYKYPEVWTFDIGSRYETKLFGAHTTFRLNVSNLFDKDYWMAHYYVGAPRTIAFSTTVSF